MAKRFIKLIDSEQTVWLIKNHPNAYILLSLIALRARRTENQIDALEVGQAHIGDHENCGLTRSQYRTALIILIRLNIIQISETCRNRKKLTINSTTKVTTKGTLVKLLDSIVFDINIKFDDHQSSHMIDHRIATGSPPDRHEQERIRKKKNDKNIEHIAQTDEPECPVQHNIHYPNSSHTPSAVRTEIFFCFSSQTFQNIQESDLSSWKQAYPSAPIEQELAQMTQWLLANPAKSKSKKLWRKFISGWLTRSNEKHSNLAAYQTQKSKQQGPAVDRRTKNMDGTPVPNAYEGRF